MIPSAQGDEWKPNKKDCDQLASEWQKFIDTEPNVTRFNSVSEATVGALFHALLDSNPDSPEYGGATYSDWSLWNGENGLHFGTYHFFNEPAVGKDTSVRPNIEVGFWTTRTSIYHTHPLVENYLSDEFSLNDKAAASPIIGYNVPITMGNLNGTMKYWRPTGTPRNVRYDPNDRSRVISGKFYGQEGDVTGAPSPETFKKIKACRDEGLL